MWFNGNTHHNKRQKRRPGDRTKGDGWDTATVGRSGARSTRGRRGSTPEWDTNGVSKWETKRLNDMLAEYDGTTGVVRDDYYWHHQTLHGLSVGEETPEWDTGRNPGDGGKTTARKQRKGRKKMKSTITGGVDCSEPEAYRLSRKFGSGQRFAAQHKTRMKKIAEENERLRKNLHRVKYPKGRANAGRKERGRRRKLRNMTVQKEKSRKNLVRKEEEEMAERESLSILNAMKYKSTFSRRNPKTDTFIKSLKTRKEKKEWERLQRSAAYIMSPRRRDNEELLAFLLEQDENDGEEEKEPEATDIDHSEKDRAAETREGKARSPEESNAAAASEDGEDEDRDRMDKFELRDLQREIGATMAEGKMSKIRDLRNFFYDVIRKYNDRPAVQKKQVQQLVYHICVELDIVAVGRLAKESPEALQIE